MKEWCFKKGNKKYCYNSVRKALLMARVMKVQGCFTYSTKLNKFVFANIKGNEIIFTDRNYNLLASRPLNNKYSFGNKTSISSATSAYFGVKNKLNKTGKKYYRLPKGEYRWNDNMQDYEYVPNW